MGAGLLTAYLLSWFGPDPLETRSAGRYGLNDQGTWCRTRGGRVAGVFPIANPAVRRIFFGRKMREECGSRGPPRESIPRAKRLIFERDALRKSQALRARPSIPAEGRV